VHLVLVAVSKSQRQQIASVVPDSIPRTRISLWAVYVRLAITIISTCSLEGVKVSCFNIHILYPNLLDSRTLAIVHASYFIIDSFYEIYVVLYFSHVTSIVKNALKKWFPNNETADQQNISH